MAEALPIAVGFGICAGIIIMFCWAWPRRVPMTETEKRYRVGRGRWLTIRAGNGGWWATIEKPGWRMDRGPYWFKWMARLAFPINRWIW